MAPVIPRTPSRLVKLGLPGRPGGVLWIDVMAVGAAVSGDRADAPPAVVVPEVAWAWASREERPRPGECACGAVVVAPGPGWCGVAGCPVVAVVEELEAGWAGEG